MWLNHKSFPSRLEMTPSSVLNQLLRLIKKKEPQFLLLLHYLTFVFLPVEAISMRVRVWVCVAVGGRGLPAGRCLVSCCQ